MKYTLLLLLTATAFIGHAQTMLVPGKNIIEKKYLKSGTYEWAYFMETDGQLDEAFSFTLSINYTGKTLSIYTNMTMLLDTTGHSTDTSICDANTFKPIYRSSNSEFHEMVVNYGKDVNGYYYDKQTRKKHIIKEQGNAFFDSYTYPYLLALLPLTTGYSKEFTVFDFIPDNSTNLKKTRIENVISDVYVSKLTGEHKVWQVSVYEEATKDSFVYYIDQETRRIWKIDFVMRDKHRMFIDKEVEVKLKKTL